MKKIADSRSEVLAAIKRSQEQVPSDATLPPQAKKYAAGVPDFVAKLTASPATIDNAKSFAEVPALVARFCKKNKLGKEIAVTGKQLEKLAWEQAKLKTATKWHDKLSLAVTQCSGAIAETGQFIVTNNSPEAWLSLVAPIHIVVITTAQIKASLNDLESLLGDKPPSSLTLVHGPSRTGDIEQTLIMGAHGPGQVHAILVEAV